MSEKPQKRLVSKGQYLKTLGDKGASYAAGVFYGLLGVPFLLISLFCFVIGLYGLFFSGFPSEISIVLFIAVISLILSMGAFWGCTSYFKRAQEIELVAPITRHNTDQLPAVETLVRASDAPPSHQQAELLRASPQGSETPPEELLRATLKGTNGQDG
ncbi:MAG: hypothetical protein JWL77_590 [Chthonomonadaceae bacterium]|nr:hypothetical protein [Chthonomonadaceae bacterium]